MRTGGHKLKGGPTVTDKERGILDWVNLPQGTKTISLWDCLHDAHVVCIVSNLVERTMVLSCDIEHLRSYCGLAEEFQFVLNLENVQSARVLRYAVWPGEFAVPKGASREEESLLIAENLAEGHGGRPAPSGSGGSPMRHSFRGIGASPAGRTHQGGRRRGDDGR